MSADSGNGKKHQGGAPSGQPPAKALKRAASGVAAATSDSDLYRKEFSEYRPSLKVIDCTIRDGGLMNQWRFSDEFVKNLYEANVAAGVDYMEMGYFTSEKYFKRTEVGPWRFCAKEDLARIVGENKTNLKLSGMCDIGRIDECDIPNKKDSLLDMVRVACYAHQIDEAVTLATLCKERGYEVSINLMAVAKIPMSDIDMCLEKVAKCNCDYFYLADSFGSFYGEQTRILIRKYREALPGKEIGLHGHHNQQLGFANSIDSIIEGANMIDGSVMGLGRGAGNTPLENLLCFLKNPKYDPAPIFRVMPMFYELKKTIEWGISIPYLISGIRNEHPKDAMAWEKAGKSRDGLGFYDKFIATDPEKYPEFAEKETEKKKKDPNDRVPNLNIELYRKDFHEYKPMIKILDNTIRDGGLCNDWKFDDDCVKAVYQACVDAGVDYMEVGYFTSPGHENYVNSGPWRFCKQADLTRVFGENRTALKLSAMADVGRVTAEDIPHKRDSLIDLVRVAAYTHQMSEAIELANACNAKGYETGIFLMAASASSMAQINTALDDIAHRCRCNIVHIVDSYGSLYCEQVEILLKMCQEKLPGRSIGFHGKNNQHMAFANTVQACCTLNDALVLDGAIYGFGRGAGCTPTENLLAFLKNPKFKLRPVLAVIKSHIQPVADELDWGPSIPYLISGARNLHPRDAIAWEKSGRRLDGVGFYEFIKAREAKKPAGVGGAPGGRTPPMSPALPPGAPPSGTAVPMWLTAGAPGGLLKVAPEECC